MKLTAKTLVLGGIGILLLAGILGVVFHKLFVAPPPAQPKPKSPKDTPVVVVGGSIRPTAFPADTYGWTELNSSKSYSAAASASTAAGGVGIDLITFANFDNNPDPISKTGGWALTYADHNPDLKRTRHANAVKVCSDSSCSASATTVADKPNQSVCPNALTFTGSGPIYAFADDRARWEKVKSGKEITELHFHDTHLLCDGPISRGEAACDKIYDVQVETCSKVSLSLTCTNANGKCNVTIGQ
jgi:hypothetical protein